MTNSALPSLPSATFRAPYRTAAAIPAVTPWRRVLAVEPDIAVLDAKSLLLARANYRVTPATGEGDLFSLRHAKAFALAILSDRLGQRLLGSVARIIRRQWPRTRILILGHTTEVLDDYLYDEQIYRSSDPQQVLADLETLYEGMWNQRSGNLDWDATRSAIRFARPPISESDPTKSNSCASVDGRSFRDMPSDLRIPMARARLPKTVAA